ncbi:15-hydroxyprostaglandin dehydrogenase [NAD(+)]-like isoform X1 [Diorhabda carinulata]|uniref:15-hydroxyprostaglandin dehydrogenase [NAD(+)]-like isoform X1 n=1 Tax=Diorhabda carinulata TaxID=1163345 RepID=UPI0025A1418E|nr:15-hydroxyprostaglandin dehydrogenase [NAD(+)]-like isoform X1 [Diorhabda carinulata]
MFEIKGKVALVTGGADGIGLSHIEALLHKGCKGVVIADINQVKGEDETKRLEKKFGKNRVVFVKTDIADIESFENAFKVTIRHFGNIDILINNAGICNDSIWEKEIDINLKGTVNGMLLGLEKYLKQFKQGNEAVILNTSSVCLIETMSVWPVYVSTKFGILGLTKEWGNDVHYDRTKVKVVAICPGPTYTSISTDLGPGVINQEYEDILASILEELTNRIQSSDFVAKEAIKVIEQAPNGSLWIIEETKEAYQFILPSKI